MTNTVYVLNGYAGDDAKNEKVALSLLCHLLTKKVLQKKGLANDETPDAMKYIYEKCKVSFK